jgi:D-tyrosyl-tRNA(Tyr) deacylase
MKLVIQRVSHAHVDIDGATIGTVDHGLCALVGITHTDTLAECEWMAEKLLALRVFQDKDGKMNLSARDTGGGILLVSQFTLYGDLTKGTRPSYMDAARPEHAEPLYYAFVDMLRSRAYACETPLYVETGVFGAMMQVHIVNDGPVTIILERNAVA